MAKIRPFAHWSACLTEAEAGRQTAAHLDALRSSRVPAAPAGIAATRLTTALGAAPFPHRAADGRVLYSDAEIALWEQRVARRRRRG